LLLAVRSSLPIVTRTVFLWKVLANRRTASGQVALTMGRSDIRFQDEKGSTVLTHHGLPVLPLLGVRNDSANVVFETFIEHTVRFVQNQIRDPMKFCINTSLEWNAAGASLAEITDALIDQVQNATGCSNHYPHFQPTLVCIFQHLDLWVLWYTTKDADGSY
jgi:hypothetical protein